MSKKINENKELSARIMAVQAYYEITQNAKPIRIAVQEHLERDQYIDIDGEEIPKPHGALFKRILFSVDDRHMEVEEILKAHYPPKDSGKEMEPLLKSILVCGITEILVHDDIDLPLIIDDYLNVTHCYYEKQQVSLVNGILDKIAKIIRV